MNLLLNWRVWAAAGIAVLMLAVYVQTVRLTACKAEYAKFVGGVEALGKAAQKAAQDKAMQDKLFKENADAENARTTDGLRADLDAARKRLRDERARGRTLSAPAATAASPDKTCFNPALLAGAIQRLDEGIGRFEEGVLGIVESGSQAVIDLDTARRWAQQQ